MTRTTKIILCITLILGLATAVDARTIRDFFLTENAGVFKMLPTNRRSDMLAYYDVGRLMPTENNLGENATLVKVTDDYLTITTSAVSDVQMALLKSKKDSVILVVTTVKIPSKDSRIQVFDTEWNEISVDKVVKLPEMEDFVVIPKGSKVKKSDVTEQVRFPIISYTVDSLTKQITARQELKEFMSDEDYAKIEPYLAPSVECKYRKGYK